MTIEHASDRGTIYRARAEHVYPTIAPGSVELVISDGPYWCAKAAWDRFKNWSAFRAWYEPHVEAWGRVCAPSATVYLWGTQRSVRELVPVMEAAGWSYGPTVTWLKENPQAQKGHDAARCWLDFTETCDVWTRCAIESDSPTGPGTLAAHAAGADERNWIRVWLRSEWFDGAGLTMDQARTALGVAFNSGLPSHFFSRSQWQLPTWDRYQQLAAYAAQHGPPRERPYFVHPDAPTLGTTFEHLRAEFEHLRATHDHLRAEYEAARRHFVHPVGVGNVWTHPQVAGAERLRGLDGKTLHPCQKPLAFYDRIIRASSRPGSLVLEPFGGTCRAAVACEVLPADEARRYICIEPDEDGRDYLAAVVASLAPPPLFAGAAK